MLSEAALKELLVNPTNGPQNHFISTCPFCEKPKHFYIHKGINRKGLQNAYDCKKCDASGTIFTFLAKLNKLNLLEGRQVYNDQLERLSVDNNKEIEYTEVDVPDKKLPIGSKLIVEGSKEHEYLKKRKFTDIDFEYYRPHFTKLISKFSQYVIIPIQQDFSIKGYVTRYGVDKSEQDYNPEKMRYINSSNTNFGCLLAGIDEVNHKTKTAILVEGFFDKISVTTELNLHFVDELKCLCSFGKKISVDQIRLIKKTSIENIILMYDERDAVNDMKKIAFELKKNFNVMVASTGDNDPGDCNKFDFYKILDNLKTADEFWLDKIPKKKFN